MIFRDIRKLNLKVGDKVLEVKRSKISYVSDIRPYNKYRYITNTNTLFNLYGLSNDQLAELFQGNPSRIKSIMCNYAHRVIQYDI